MTKRQLKTGQLVWVVSPNKLDKPEKGTIVAITKAPGKTIGVEFTKPIGRNSLDGRVKHPHGLWCLPGQCLNDLEFKQLKARVETEKQRREAEQTSFDTLTLELDPVAGVRGTFANDK